MNNNRVQWCDISKGITISLMVLGHTSIPVWLSHWIFSFHMPFFFFISALFVNWEKGTYMSFVVRKSKSILIPFAIYSVINLIFWPVVNGMSFNQTVNQLIYNGWGGVALWFIPVFYLSSIICRAIPQKNLITSFVIGLILGELLNFYGIMLLWNLSSVPFAVAIMAITRRFSLEIRKVVLSTNGLKSYIHLILTFILGMIGCQYWQLDLAWNKVSPIIPITILALMGIYFVIIISKIISRIDIINKLLSVIGQNTYEVMALSQIAVALASLYIQNSIIRLFLPAIIIACAIFVKKYIVNYANTIYLKCRA